MLIKFDFSNTSYYAEVENGALVAWSWKIILGGHGKLRKSHGKFLGEKCGNPELHFMSCSKSLLLLLLVVIIIITNKADRRRLEAFEMWIWRRLEK